MKETEIFMAQQTPSFFGPEDELEGVKLETRVRVTETSCEIMSDYPFELRLMCSD